jgi:hypothetical protein
VNSNSVCYSASARGKVLPACYSDPAHYSASLCSLVRLLVFFSVRRVFYFAFWCSARRAGKFYELQSVIEKGEIFFCNGLIKTRVLWEYTWQRGNNLDVLHTLPFLLRARLSSFDYSM